MSADTGQLFQGSIVTVNLNVSNISERISNDASAHRITILVDGYYQLIGKITWNAPVIDKSYWTYLYKNGSALANAVTQPSVSAPFSGIVIEVAYLKAGDYIELKGYQDSGSNVYNRTETNLIINKL